MTTANYAANEVTVNVAGIPINSGRGPDGGGEFCKLEKKEDSFGFVESEVDGDGAWYRKKGSFTTMTLTLMQSSASNDLLSALHQLDLSGGAGEGPAFVKDGKGTSVFVATSCRVLKTPDQTYAVEPGTNVWVIGCHGVTRFVGGNG